MCVASLWVRVCGGLFAALCLAAEAAAAAEPLTADPAVMQGTMPSGMAYVIAPNSNPKGALSLRLTFDVGSVEEAEAERGAAHFIEHMAFRATRHFPEGELERAFAAMGVSAGRDQNAFTSPRRTIYVLDLPDASTESRRLALQWLRDVADGVVFDAAAVDRERGVVLAERDARAAPDELVLNTITAFQAPELRSTQRPPIGELGVLHRLTPATLQGFYTRWYRPEHARLTIVGDTAAMKGLMSDVIDTFGDWRGAGGPLPARAPSPPPDARRGLDAVGVSEPRVDSGLSVCRLRAPELPIADTAQLQRRMLQLVAITALQARLDQLRFTDLAVLDAQLDINDAEGERRQLCVTVAAAPEDWRAALKAVQLELRRFTDEGPGQDEIEAALIEIRGGLLGEITDAASRTSPDVATDLAMTVADGEVRMEPRQQMRAVNKALEGWTRERVQAAWREDWSGAGPFVAAVGESAPSGQQILAAWAENQVAPTSAYVKRAAPQWAYRAGSPGKVLDRTKDGSFVRLRFDNGVAMNFKRTEFSKGVVEVRVDLGEGRRALGSRSASEGGIAADSFTLGGLGRHSYAELKAIFGDEPLRLEFSMENRAFTFASHSYLDRLPAQLLLMSTYLLDPGFRDELDAKLPAELAADERASLASPLDVIYERIDALAGNPVPPAAELSRLTSRDFEAWLKPIVTHALLEVTLVGDISEAEAIELVSKTFGALPPREGFASPTDYRGFGRFPAAATPRIELTHSGPADKTMVAMVWPLFVADPSRRREQRALRLLGALFDDELRQSVRERLGKAYAPFVDLSAPDRADQAYLIAAVETAPADLPLVEAEMHALAARLAAGDIDSARLEAARKPLLSQVLNLRTDNIWWAQTRQIGRQDLLDVAEGESPLASISAQEVRAAATAWLTPAPIVLIATPELRK